MTKKLAVMTVALCFAMVAHAQDRQTQQRSLGKAASIASVTTQTPAVPAPMRVPRNAKLFIEPTDFGKALSAAILKKKVPVVVITDRDNADFFAQTTSNVTQEKTAERVTKVLVLGNFAGRGQHFEATATVTNRDGAVVFAHNANKGDIRRAAEDTANQLKKDIERK